MMIRKKNSRIFWAKIRNFLRDFEFIDGNNTKCTLLCIKCINVGNLAKHKFFDVGTLGEKSSWDGALANQIHIFTELKYEFKNTRKIKILTLTDEVCLQTHIEIPK